MITDEQFYEVFENIATNNKNIAHSSINKRFFKNPDDINEKDITKDFFMVMLPPRYHYQDDKSDNIFERFKSSFLILKPVERENYSQQLSVTTEARNIARQILARMKKMRIEFALKEFTIGDCQGDSVGPVLENCFGVTYEFSIGDSAGIIYEPSDWLDS